MDEPLSQDFKDEEKSHILKDYELVSCQVHWPPSFISSSGVLFVTAGFYVCRESKH